MVRSAVPVHGCARRLPDSHLSVRPCWLTSVYPSPEAELASATVIQLDDQFFTSDPFAYIRSRITTLLCDREISMSGALAAEFSRLLGPASAHYATLDDRTRDLQVAVDAFALRHHVAETLLRFFHVVMHHSEGASYWVELIDTPTANGDVIKQNHAAVERSEDRDELLRAVFLPPGVTTLEATEQGPDDARDLGASASGGGGAHEVEDLTSRVLSTHVAWIDYAIALLMQQSPDLNAAHNKLKHGMGLRPQDDVLTTLTTTPPSAGGELPLSALSSDRAINLFDGVTTEFLARKSRRHGLEATQLAMAPAPTLAETAAMAHSLALLFHAAALKHFGDREPVEGRGVPAHPGFLLDGPQPGTLRSVRPFALRFPLTTPLRAPAASKAQLYWTDGDVQTVTFGERIRGVVVDDVPEADGPLG